MKKLGFAMAAAACIAMTYPANAQEVGPSVGPGQRVTVVDMLKRDPLPPADIYRPAPDQGPRHRDLAIFAWLEFIALNAPVKREIVGVDAGLVKERGVPGGSFADSGKDQNAILVWESYQHRAELFPYGTTQETAAPRPFDENPPVYVYQPVDGSPFVVKDLPDNQFNNLDEASQIGQNLIFLPGDEEPYQFLFQAKVNRIESDYVRAAHNAGNISISIDKETGLLKSDETIDLPDNAIEIKSGWVSVDAIPEDQRYRYHLSDVVFYENDPNNPDQLIKTHGTYALLGLHIIQKTPNYPAFIFATFEQMDALEDPDTGDPTGLFYIPTYGTIEYELPQTTTLSGVGGEVATNPTLRFNVNKPTARPNNRKVDLPVGPVTSISGAQTEGDNVLVPVTQPPTTNNQVERANREVLRAMQRIPGFNEDFVWQYYRLKGVQGVPTSDETYLDYYLADIVIESSQPGVQLFRGGFSIDGTTTPPTLNNTRNQVNVLDAAQDGAYFSVGGCQGCHGVAQTKAGFDFSFIFGGANGGGFEPDAIGLQPQAVMLERSNRYMLKPGGRPDLLD